MAASTCWLLSLLVSFTIARAEFQIRNLEDFPFISLKNPHKEQKAKVWGPPLSAEDFANAQKLEERTITDEERLAIRRGVESEVFHRDKRGKISNSKVNNRWPNNEVPYEIDPAFTTSDRATIAAAMTDVTSHTCIRYRSRTATDLDWMIIVKDDAGCYAFGQYYGPGFGAHTVGLASPGCMYKGIIVHEFLHILAIFHEMCRPDRDDYVEINWLNVNVKMAYNFWKTDWEDAPSGLNKCSDQGLTEPTDFSQCVDGQTVTSYGTPYDFNSVMHYALDAFAVDPKKPTLIPKNSSVDTRYIGSQSKLGPNDILGINRAYSCLSTQPSYGGGNYQGCGGILNGTAQSNGIRQWVISANQPYGIYLNFTSWTCGGGNSCELKIWDAVEPGWGNLVASFNATNPANPSLVLNGNQAYIRLTATDPAVAFQATWGCASFDCCESIVLTSNNSKFLDSSVYARNVTTGSWSQNGTLYNDRHFYIHSSGNFCLWYNKLLITSWVVSLCNLSLHPDNGILYGFGTSQCPEFRYIWLYPSSDRSSLIIDSSMQSACSPGVTAKPPQLLAVSTTTPAPVTTPAAPVSALGGCCVPFVLNTTSQNFVNFSYYHIYIQGEYYAQPGAVFNGRQVYIHSEAYACMWYTNESNWLVGACSTDKNSTTNGYVYGVGNGACPDSVTRWAFFDQQNQTIVDDPSMAAVCAPGAITSISNINSTATTITITNTTSTTITTIPSTSTLSSTSSSTGSTTSYSLTATASTTTTTAETSTTSTSGAGAITSISNINSTATTITTTTTTSTTITTAETSTTSTSGAGSTTETGTTGILMDCPSCLSVLDGKYYGLYTLVSRNDSRCPGGCVYWTTQETNQFCFQPEGAEPVANCN